jgi:hypothetical protein
MTKSRPTLANPNIYSDITSRWVSSGKKASQTTLFLLPGQIKQGR